MSDNSKIEWTDATVNAINGCSVTSPGCTNCYAMRLAGTRMKRHPSRAGLTVDSKAGPVWNGEVRFSETALLQPLRWKRPRTIFWNAHGDMFHENVPDEWIDRCFAVMALTPHHRHQVLTKRSARMRTYFEPDQYRRNARAERVRAQMQVLQPGRIGGLPAWPLPNVWLGVSVEDQARADERIPDLLATPAAVRFLSCEPLLGPVDLNHVKFYDRITQGGGREAGWESALNGTRFELWADDDEDPNVPGFPKIDWVIAGGESGPCARPMHPDWARSIRDQCAAAGVPFHFKQWGEWAPGECIGEPVTRTETGAHFFNGAWSFEDFSPRIAAELHIDDEPVLWQCGKKRAGRLLDGVQHDGWPA